MKSKKVVIVYGTRPEAIKLIPVYLALRKNKNVDAVLVSTGQHQKMLDDVLHFFQVKSDYNLEVMRQNQDLPELSSVLISKLNILFKEIKPEVVVVQGDTATSFVGALVAYYHKIKVAHVEAGLRTYNKYSPFPEESLRRMVASITDIHFAPTESAKMHLINENHDSSQIFVVGNTVIDSLLMAKNIITSKHHVYKKKFEFLFSDKTCILITTHRRENFGEGLKNIIDALIDLAKRYETYYFLFPVHFNPNVYEPVHKRLGSFENIKLIAPLPYDDLVYFMLNSKIIITDSGGIQEEAPSLGKPVIVIRDTTERPEGVAAGCSVLAGTLRENIVNTFIHINDDPEVYKQMAEVINPYGDGKSAERIETILNKLK